MPQTRELAGSYARTLVLERSAVNEDARTVEIAISSEIPVERWFGIEILGHGPGEVDLARLQDGAPLLMDHDVRDHVGVVESVSLGTDRVLRGVVRFGRSARAQEVFQDVLDGIRSKISVGYQIQRYETTKGEKGAPDQIRVTRWLPLETSFVSVPADNCVGVGRSLNPPAIEAGHMEDRNMPDTTTNQAAPVANPPAVPPTQAEGRNLITPEVRSFLATAEKLFGSQGRTAAEEILGQVADLGRAGTELMQRMESKPLPAPTPSLQELGASERELKGYSYTRALASVLDQAEGRSVKRGFEHEVSETLQRAMPAAFEYRGGILVPLQVRALVTGTATSGKELVVPEKGELIDMLRAMAVSLRMGARFLSGLTAPITFPKITGGATASWMAENSGGDVADSQLSTGTITLSPKTLQASTPISRQLLYTSSEDAEAMIRQDLAKAHALAWDRAVLHGTGTNQPTGIYGAAGVNAVAMGGNPTWGKLVDLVTEIAKDNALLGTIGFVTTPGAAGKMMQTLVAEAAGSEMLWTGAIEDGRVGGYRALASNQVAANLGAATNEHGIVCGDWAQVMIGQWGPGFELIIDPYAKKKQGLVEFTSFEMVDMALRYAEAFAKGTGMILS